MLQHYVHFSIIIVCLFTLLESYDKVAHIAQFFTARFVGAEKKVLYRNQCMLNNPQTFSGENFFACIFN